ncbi:hypothetical protein E2C01_079660 [Portunus trituberculatus]|uniref:Uncharacterized protein n=1 Tax=Portunus trituberculatus TaxID=210409 RepID=A0A5B7IW75_PORTR|nr:hypothetical protein [Portunus trituberculatus]
MGESVQEPRLESDRRDQPRPTRYYCCSSRLDTCWKVEDQSGRETASRDGWVHQLEKRDCHA